MPGWLRGRANVSWQLIGWVLAIAIVLPASPLAAAEPPGSANFTAPREAPDYFSNEGGAGRGVRAAPAAPAPAPVVAAPGPSRETAAPESEQRSYVERPSYRSHGRREARFARGHVEGRRIRGGRAGRSEAARSHATHVQTASRRSSGGHDRATKGHTAAARGHTISGKEKRFARGRG